MYQDSNGNLDLDRHGCLVIKRKVLPCIYEGQYLDNRSVNTALVPDVNLQCEEVIEDWDEIDDYDAFSPVKNEKMHSVNLHVDSDSFCMYDDQFPPPNSPVAGMEEDIPVLMLQNKYVNSLLQMWRDTKEVSEMSIDNIQEDLSQDDGDDGLSLTSDDQSSCSQSSQSDHDNIQMSSLQEDMLPEIEGQHDENNPHSFPAEHDLYSNSSNSSRSASPTMLESFPQSVMRFDNLRSVSPRILRSPSPISSRSSSPRFMRSPSPLGEIQFGISTLPLDDISDGIVFYEDRYIHRSRSPLYSSDHEVPDVDMEFHDVVSQSNEFPSFQTYQQRRTRLNSCQDQVVPEYIEE